MLSIYKRFFFFRALKNTWKHVHFMRGPVTHDSAITNIHEPHFFHIFPCVGKERNRVPLNTQFVSLKYKKYTMSQMALSETKAYPVALIWQYFHIKKIFKTHLFASERNAENNLSCQESSDCF